MTNEAQGTHVFAGQPDARQSTDTAMPTSRFRPRYRGLSDDEKKLHDARKDTGFLMRITNHDAVLGDALAPDTMAKVSAILNRQSFPFKVPILWELGSGPSWAGCKKG